MSELEQLEEELRLLSESSWYINWALAFIVFAFITEMVALIELFTGNVEPSLAILGVSLIPAFIGSFLHKKSREYYRKALGDDE